MAKKAPFNDHLFSPVKSGLVHAVLSQGADRVAPLVARCRGKEVVRVAPERLAEARDKKPLAPEAGPLGDRLTREKRVLLSEPEESALNELVHRLATSGATSVKLSHLLRACIVILRHAEPELVEHVRLAARLVRPPNGSGTLLADFERRLAQQVAAAIKSAPPLG